MPRPKLLKDDRRIDLLLPGDLLRDLDIEARSRQSTRSETMRSIIQERLADQYAELEEEAREAEYEDQEASEADYGQKMPDFSIVSQFQTFEPPPKAEPRTRPKGRPQRDLVHLRLDEIENKLDRLTKLVEDLVEQKIKRKR